MKNVFILLFLSVQFVQAQSSICALKHQHGANAKSATIDFPLDSRSDSIDILHYTIALDLDILPNDFLTGWCEITFSARVNDISTIVLDLLALQTDSVMFQGESIAFSHIGEKLSIELPISLNSGEGTSLRIYYSGTPVLDASGFGGFEYDPGYTYNIGVGFLAQPHNFGRVWFPCFDNFTERSAYTYIIRTPENLTSICGGVLTDEFFENGKRVRQFECYQEIPTYLASVAVANFEQLNYTYESVVNPSLPVQLNAVAGDTNNVKNAFVNLEASFHLYEELFGPYLWDKIGYVFVPFAAGAMEHTMNVAYPRFLIVGGSTTSQTTMAHELAHSWFGNLATCRTAEEMWLNEGFASYAEYLFEEFLINRATYDATNRNTLRRLLQLCHISDGGYWAISGVPQEHTYGSTSYEKGATVLHSLRSYMGDSAFFQGLRYYTEQYAFKDARAVDLRDALQESSGIELEDFFADWVYTPGWAGFEIDSFKLVNNQIRVFTQQKSAGNDRNFSNVPFTITFRDNNFNLFEIQGIKLSGPIDSVDVDVPFMPSMVYLNRDEKINQAVTADERIISTTGLRSFPNALVDIITNSVVDSVFVRAEHYWVAPDSIRTPYAPFKISPNRYWQIYCPESNFEANARFTYNARTNNTTGGWLDHELITNEPDVVILYRKDAKQDWSLHQPFTQSMQSSSTDGFGLIVIENLKPGQYAFAQIDSSLGLHNSNPTLSGLRIFPNPSQSDITLVSAKNTIKSVIVYDMSGRIILNKAFEKPSSYQHLVVNQLQDGLYFVKAEAPNGVIETSSLIIRK